MMTIIKKIKNKTRLTKVVFLFVNIYNFKDNLLFSWHLIKLKLIYLNLMEFCNFDQTFFLQIFLFFIFFIFSLINPITAGRVWVFPPPVVFSQQLIIMAYIRTLKLLHFFNTKVVNKYKKTTFFWCIG